MRTTVEMTWRVIEEWQFREFLRRARRPCSHSLTASTFPLARPWRLPPGDPCSVCARPAPSALTCSAANARRPK